MDKLATLKIRHPDGSYSNPILLTVLAQNVKYDTTNSVLDVLNRINARLDNIIVPDDSISIDKLTPNLRSTINGIPAMVGTPLTASSASAMSNQDKIYVYTGTTTSSLTNGHWYYYDNGWKDGGVYNSQGLETDKTLTVSGSAADAKITGDEINILKNEIESNFQGITGTHPLTFKRGYYGSETINFTDETVSFRDSSSYVCAIAPCQEGDQFVINIYAPSGIMRGLFFVDANMKHLQHSATINAVLNLTVTAPANSAYAIFNNKLSGMSSGYYAYMGEPLLTKFNSAILYKGNLSSSDNLNDIRQRGCYRWLGSSLPINTPTAYGSSLFVNGISGVCSQFVINTNGLGFLRAYGNGQWSEWATIQDTTGISETITGITSYATITGDEGTSYIANGITLTKVSDGEFTFRGRYNKTAGSAFNILLGANQVFVGTKTEVMDPNITEPGVYTLAYKISGYNTDASLFAISDTTFEKRQYLKSGESFRVNEPMSLFVYGPSNLNLHTKTLTVKWALYKGEEYEGLPYVQNGQLIAYDPIARQLASTSSNMERSYSEYTSWGLANLIARADQIMKIKWTPVASTMPMGNSSFYEMGTEYQGIPYSSVRDSNTSVGTNISIHSFMTAVRDPNSVLYKRKSNTQNATTYYGAVCSGLCNYSYNLGLNLTNYYLGESDMFEDVPLQDLQTGDMIYIPGHVAMILGIKKDRFGRICDVKVMEEWFPTPRYRHYNTWNRFVKSREGYVARRFKYISEIPYEESPYVYCFDEDEKEIIYPDVQTDHGDAFVFKTGDNVNINVIDPKDFTSIVVKRGDTTIFTTSSIDNFSLQNVQPGLHTITASGGSNTSVSTFFVADVNGSFNVNTGIVTFSSSNATPVLVDVYNVPDPDENGKINVRNFPYILSDEERDAGRANVSSLIDDTHRYAKVTFNTPYGQAIWRSETHQTWVPSV